MSEFETQKANLEQEVSDFGRSFTNLENMMAMVLHHVIFSEVPGVGSRIAHAIYFTPEGFYQRQMLVNSAITEWLIENPNPTFDFLPMWDEINDRINTVRKARNAIAHGTVRALLIRNQSYIRVVPPTFDPMLQNLVDRGTIPGRSLADMKKANAAVFPLMTCLSEMINVIKDRHEGEQTLRDTYAALRLHLNQLSELFPDARKPQARPAPPEPFAE